MLTSIADSRRTVASGFVLTVGILVALVVIGGVAVGMSIAEESPPDQANHVIVADDEEMLSSLDRMAGDSLTKTDVTATVVDKDELILATQDSTVGLNAPILQTSAGASFGHHGEWSTLYGHSASGKSATVVDGVIYVVSDDGDESTIHAVDVKTGQALWSEPLEPATQQLGGHAPTVVDGTVYVGSHWHLHAFDAQTGEMVWDEPKFLGTTIATSPTVYDDHVLVGTRGGSLRSFDANNGSEVWVYRGLDRDWAGVDSWAQSEHSSVTIVDGVVYATGGTEIHALELTDPAVEPVDPIWTWETPNEGNRDDQITGALTVLEDTAFVHVNTYEGVTMIGGQARGSYSSNLVALDVDEGTEEWIFEVDHAGSRGTSSPTAVSDHGDATVYLHANDNMIYAIDADDGSIEWGQPNLYSSVSTSSPTVTEDRIYVGSNTYDDFGNGIYVMDRETGVQVDFHSTNDYRVTSSPIVVDGFVYGTANQLVPSTHGDGGKLFAFDVAEDGSSIDSRVLQATLNHHDFWTGAQRGGVAVTDAELEAEAILQDEAMSAEATFTNFGSASVEHEAALRIGDYGTIHETIHIDEYGETQDILDSVVTETGTYAISLDGVDLGTLHVVDPAEPVYLAEGELVDDVVWVERDIEVNATFTNIGDVDLGYETNITADGTEIATDTIPIDADDSTTTTLSGQVTEPGVYEIAVDGISIGTVEVLADPTYLVDGSVVNERILVDETVDVELELRNLAAHKETHEATLAVGEVASTETAFDLDGDVARTESVSLTVDETGTFNVTYGNETIGGVEVLAEAVHLLDAELVDRHTPTAYPHEDVEVRLLYENVASSERTHAITITDDDTITETSVTLDAHDREIVSVNLTDLEEGVYDLAADDEPIETLYVGNYDHFIFENNSIQAVLDNTTTNDRIGVAGGVYNESLTVDVEGVSISNFAGEEPILDGERVIDRAIFVEADDVHVDGFTIIRFIADGLDGAVYVRGDASGFEFRENNMTDNRNALFLWDGDGSVIANNTITDNDGVGFESNLISEIEIIGNNISNNTGDGILVDGFGNFDNWIITGNQVTNNTGAGIDTTWLSDGEISYNQVHDNNGGITAGSRTNITDNTLLGNRDGQFGSPTGGIDSGADAVVANNTVTDVEGTGIEPSGGVIVENNTVIDAGTVGIEISNSNIQITNNTLAGHEADILFTSGVGTVDSVFVANNTLETGIELHAVDDGLVDAPHTMENNTVGGAPLYYAANVDDPTIDPDAGQIILVNVTNADISGFEFENVVAGIQLSHVNDSVVSDNEIRNVETRFLPDTGALGVWHSRSTEIVDNTIEDVDRTGIHVVDSTELTVAHNVITDTREDGIQIDGFASEANTIEGNLITGVSTGIEASGNDDGVISDNHVVNTDTAIDHSGDRAEVTQNAIEASDMLGISVNGDEIVVTDNTVVDSQGDGMSVNGDDIVVSHNTVTDSLGGGMMVSGSDGTTVSSNTVTGSDGVGMEIDVDDAGSTISKNTVRSNVEGMYVEGRFSSFLQNTTIDANTIDDNTDLGIYIDGGQDVLLTNNSVTGNGDGLRFAGWQETLNATNNWWGASDGPSGDIVDPETDVIANGTGDSIEIIYEEAWVEFDPWIDVAPADPSSLAVYANEDDVIETDGLRDAVDDWRVGDIDTQFLRDVVDAWRSGQPV